MDDKKRPSRFNKALRIIGWAAAGGVGLALGQGGTDGGGRCLCPLCTGFGLFDSKVATVQISPSRPPNLPQVPKS